MQLRLHRKRDGILSKRKLIVKTVLFIFIFSLALILLDKIEIAAPIKLIKQEISNDKLITLK